MNKGLVAIFIIFGVIVTLAQIGGCVECERAGGVYVKTVYGTHQCMRK